LNSDEPSPRQAIQRPTPSPAAPLSNVNHQPDGYIRTIIDKQHPKPPVQQINLENPMQGIFQLKPSPQSEKKTLSDQQDEPVVDQSFENEQPNNTKEPVSLHEALLSNPLVTLGDPLFFGASEKEIKCEDTWGKYELQLSRDSKQEICSPKDSTSLQSTVYSYSNSRGNEAIIEFRNVEFRFESVPRFRPDGAVFSCRKTVPGLSGKCISQPGRELYSRADASKSLSTESVEPRFVLFVNRDGSSNLFHSIMDHVMAFYSLSVIGIDHKDVLIVLTDTDPNHPAPGMYENLWEALSSHQVIMARDYPRKGSVLVEHGAFSTLAGCSIGWVNHRDFGDWLCPSGSTLIKSFARNVLSTFNMFTIPPPPKPSILFISRAINNEAHVQPRVGRQIKNEKELISILECDKSITVRSVDFVGVPILEQLDMVRKSNILVGMHGAGLSHMMFLPEEAVVVELFPMNWDADSFRNLARMSGKKYISWQNTHRENHFPDSGIERGQPDKQAATHVDVAEFKALMNVAVNMARNFGSGFAHHGLSC